MTCKGVSYYENPTVEEQKRFGASGELLYNAEGNTQLAMHVEKMMKVFVFNREMIGFFYSLQPGLVVCDKGHCTKLGFASSSWKQSKKWDLSSKILSRINI